MQLTVRQVATLFNVSEKTVYRWIKAREIPAYRVNEQYRFHRAELLEWATMRRIGVSAEIVQEDGEGPLPTLTEALLAGGMAYRLIATDMKSALGVVVEAMRLPKEVDRAQLLQVLLAREALTSTAIGDGVAIPHVRNPIVLHISRPAITLCFLERPVDFGALDGKPVHCLFTMISPTVRAHLTLLSRLAFAMRDSRFQGVIRRQAPPDEILTELRRVEAGLAQTSIQPTHAAGEQAG